MRDLHERVRSFRRDDDPRAIAKRVAGGTFALRVVNAAIAFLSQILLARWMGEHEYGIYAYVWVWLLVLGGLCGMGLPTSSQRFIPQYREAGDLAGLRGFLAYGRLLALGVATLLSLACAAAVWALGDAISPWHQAPLYLVLCCLPAWVLMDIQDGIARSYNWVDVGVVITFCVRPLLVLGLIAVMHFAGAPSTAVWATVASLIAIWIAAMIHSGGLNFRLARVVPKGARRFEARTWLSVSLPILLVEGFYLLLTYSDVLILELFRSPDEVGIYYAATKVMALVAFAYFAVAAATAHRFAQYAATGDQAQLEAFVRDAVNWTFWPSLALTGCLLVLGYPMLWMFGPRFTEGYFLLPILAAGLLARSSIGPVERLLAMVGQQRATAVVYGATFALNIALNFAMIPAFGLGGAAVATAAALMVESALLYQVARRRLGLHPFIFARKVRPRVAAVPGVTVEALDRKAAAAHTAAWAELAARAIEANAFYHPGVALSWLAHLDKGGRTRVLIAWRTERHERRAIGVWMMRPDRHRYILPVPLSTAVPAYAPLGTPLLDPEHAEAAAAALLAFAEASGARALLIPKLSSHGPAARALAAAAEAGGRPHVALDAHRRAMRPAGDADAWLATIEPRRRKELARLRRRLEEHGELSFEVAAGDPERVMAALEDFLALEAAGWKGRRGTALAADPRLAAFMREAAAGLAAENRLRVALLRQDGRPIASALVPLGGTRAFYFKTAYDERLARFSPGVLLTLDLTRHLLTDPAIRDTDSVANANHPMIDRLWRDRIDIADWMIGLRPDSDPMFAAIVAAERLRARLRRQAIQVRDRIRGRR